MQELDALWQAAVEAIGSQGKEQAAAAIMKYVYYWYNFMPLARGSAMVGYTTILSLFLAAGMPISAAIPKVRPTDLKGPNTSKSLQCYLPGMLAYMW